MSTSNTILGSEIRRPAVGAPPPRVTIDRRPALVRGLDVLIRNGPISRRQLREALGSSSSTATEVVHALLERGLIAETGTTASTGGRPARVLDLSSSVGVVLSADVGATNTRVAAGSLRGTLLAHRTMSTSAALDGGGLQRMLVEGLEGVHEEAGGGRTRALAIALAGIVNPLDGSIVTTTVPHWKGMATDHLLLWMRNEFQGYPLLLENEANLAALGEHRHGEIGEADDVMFVALGAGVGAGLVLGGNLFRGHRGAAGEIGYTRLSCTGEGLDLDQLAGADALVRRFVLAGGSPSVATPEGVFHSAAVGDRHAVATIAAVIDDLAVSIANAIALFDPQKVVIGGGLAQAGSVFVDPLRDRIRTLALVPEIPEITISRLGADAALIGGIYLAGDHAREAIAAELELSAH